MKKFFKGIYQGKKVFLTGHTGFKGSWLTLWLQNMGAEVFGYSLEPIYSPSHYNLLKLDIPETFSDIRNYEKLSAEINSFKPDIVIHMAAQPLVRLSYREPLETFETNVMGTANILNACRNVDSLKGIVIITTDKCYENREWVWGYRENDPMGGHDPYSASKGCAELVTSAYRSSFFSSQKYGIDHRTIIASVRAGNVIGGGDWSEDRLIPDIVKAASRNDTVIIRSPESTRPWQHVLEPLSGYLLLGRKLLEGKQEYGEAWNFGPSDECTLTVLEVAKHLNNYWSKIKYAIENNSEKPHEANLLKLDCSKAHSKLNWKGIWNANQTFDKTAAWYEEFYENGRIITEEQLRLYLNDAINSKISWSI